MYQPFLILASTKTDPDRSHHSHESAGRPSIPKAGDTRTRNWYQKLLPETCKKNLTQFHHSFLHQS